MQFLAVFFVALVVSFAAQSFLTKKPKPPGAATLDDFEVPQVDEGTPQAVVFGDAWIEGWQVLWFGNYRTTKIKR